MASDDNENDAWERRSDQRFPADVLVYVALRGQPRRRARLQDLSAQGASVSWRHRPLPQGGRATLLLVTEEGPVVRTMNCAAEVVWCEGEGVGFRLLPPSRPALAGGWRS